MRIIVGAGSTSYPGWTPFQQWELDLTNPCQWASRFRPGSLDAILAEHVFEHLTPAQSEIATRICFHYLKPGGYLRLAVPDGFHPSPAYYEWVKPGGTWNGDDHKQLFNYLSLSGLLMQAGFRVRLLEFFDERGQLYAVPIDAAWGNIRRSSHNLYSSILSFIVGARYTSLVVDAVKA